MSALVECVPNFSEGRDRTKIDTIVRSIESVSGVTLLDVDPGRDTNRTVVTFVGEPAAVAEAAYQGIKTAAEILDMRSHSGAHPRMGATDVCPFIPVADSTVEECVALSRQVAERVGTELKIPVFLYEYSATRPERRNLAVIREGEYEGMDQKLRDSRWTPDFGPAVLHPQAGVTAIGCRDFLIAYNINLNTRDVRLATDIAFELREKGRSKRIPDPASPNLLDGTIVRYGEDHWPCSFCEGILSSRKELEHHARTDHDRDLVAFWRSYGYDPEHLVGKAVKVPGRFPHVKAIGWYIDTFKRAQISINFTRFRDSTIHDVFDAACELAAERGIRVTGSELVGLIPLEAILLAGNHYLRKQGRSTAIPTPDIIETAVQSLGLNDVTPFHPEEKIIDLAVRRDKAALIDLSVREFARECSRNSPAPGGGSVSAVAASLAAGLASMVAVLTFEKKGNRDLRPEMESIGTRAQALLNRLITLVDADTEAFQRVLEAQRLPAATAEEKDNRDREVQAAMKQAVEVPLATLEAAWETLQLAEPLVRKGNPASVSDAGVAAEMALAALRGAGMNVLINLPALTDGDYVQTLTKQVEERFEAARQLAETIRQATLEVIRSS